MSAQAFRWAMLLAALGLTACAALPGGTGPGAGIGVARASAQRERAPAATAGDLATLVEGNNRFAFDLYQALREDTDGNLIFSPYSVSQALAMVYAGARGDTEREMQDTLHFLLPQGDLHPAFNALDLALARQAEDAARDDEEGQPFRLNIANAIWGQEGHEFLQEYLVTLARNYGAGLRLADFVGAPEEARQTINGWVSEETEQKIQDLIPPGALTPDTRLVLTNAIYFNAAWLYQFEESVTRDEPFNLLDGSQVSVPTMRQREDFLYASGEGYQAIALPYYGSNMAMLIVLPDAGQFESFEAALDAGTLGSIRGALQMQDVIVTLPRFDFESEASLSDALFKMGMPSAFTGGVADFSGIDGTQELFISDVLHKATITLDENGTEAAAATAVIMELTSAMPDPVEPVEMRIDHPFIFTIYDVQSGATLFAGRVLDPSQ